MMATFYITKYALSSGIDERVDPLVRRWDDGTESVRSGDDWVSFVVGREAFTDRADAVADAEARRAKRIASLKKQIAKLEKLTF